MKAFLKENKFLSNTIIALIALLFFLFLVNFFNISYPLKVTSSTASGELAVVGVGRVEAVPDSATVSLGIVSNNAATIDEAQKEISEVNNAIVNGLVGIGIKKEDIKTTDYSINPNYDFSERGTGTITGYNGNATISVKVTDTAKLPEVIQVGTENGANQVMGTSYNVEEPEKYQSQARDLAIQNAKDEAQRLANSLGIRLGKVVNISESSTGMPMPFMYKEAAVSQDLRMGGAVSAMPAPDLQPGSQTITSTVTLYFEKR